MLDLEETVLDDALDHVKLAVDQETKSHEVLSSVHIEGSLRYNSHCPIRISR